VVIVPLDFSAGARRAVLPAGAIARRFGARVLPVSSRFGWGDKDPASELAAVTEPIGAVTDPPRVYDRFAPNAISELTRTTPDSLVCIATQGREGLARLTGSVAEDVLRQVRAPVLLVGPKSAGDPTAETGPVLICVDGSSVSNVWVPKTRPVLVEECWRRVGKRVVGERAR
jgi:nucleotide-binding universal stress UspA family protein